MKLIYKLLLSFFLLTIIIGSFSTLLLMHNINKNSDNLSVYREREITSFVKVIDAFLKNKESLKDITHIQTMFVSLTQKLPHIRRLTLHAQDKNTNQYIHIASSIPRIIGTSSYPEDIDAIKNNKTTILYENDKNENFIDITYPITDVNGVAFAALGVAVSLSESDYVLKKSIDSMKKNAIETIIFALIFTTLATLLISLLIAREITKPLNRLKDSVNLISSNKEYKEIQVNSDDEIGQLAIAFNKMSYELNILHTSMEGQIQDKTDKLKHQFLTDSLTSIPNRQALFADMNQIDEFGLAILDIAGFRDINDVYGVDIGNKVLIEVNKKYMGYLYHTGLKIYRISGDEVAILNPKMMDKKDFIEKIAHIIISIEHEVFYFEDDDIEINLSIHAGIACEKELSLEKANIALIKAKSEYLDLTVFEENDFLLKTQKNNINMITKIKNSVDNYNFIPFYQAIVDKDEKITKYEALVRMKDGSEIVSPFHFLEIAKKTKYYQHITRTMIFQALSDFEDRKEQISINLCADDLLNEETKIFIKNQIDNFKETHRIVFELVESEDLHEIKGLIEFIEDLKSTGVKIAIDDFGTGYSNFSYLLDLSPDYLKIDGSLIKNINTNEKSYNIVKTIVNFAHGLNIKVIAEFVHSKEVLAICKELNIDEYQGYYFSEPSKNIKS